MPMRNMLSKYNDYRNKSSSLKRTNDRSREYNDWIHSPTPTPIRRLPPSVLSFLEIFKPPQVASALFFLFSLTVTVSPTRIRLRIKSRSEKHGLITTDRQVPRINTHATYYGRINNANKNICRFARLSRHRRRNATCYAEKLQNT